LACQHARVRGFNPTLVRLRLGCGVNRGLGVDVFQSHAGSIEAQPSPAWASCAPWRFNPTLVRLRRGPRQICPYGSSRRFNPTLVRLRRRISGGCRGSQEQFQSHAGSIEAFPLAHNLKDFMEFQSHAGSIEAMHFLIRFFATQGGFQSHAGSIEARVGPVAPPNPAGVSIPRWFD